MSSLLLKFKKNTKDDRRNQIKSPLTHSTMATTQEPPLQGEVDEQTDTVNDSSNESPEGTASTSACESPVITIHSSTTPGPKYYSNRPPPLDITPHRKASLTVNDPFIPLSQSLDDLSCRTSGSSIDSDRASPVHRPSSPLLSALREAVDSLSNMDDFKVIEKIGSGFFSEVFKVEHVVTKQIMVMKINHRETANQTKREVEVLKKLSHPNLLHYVGACVHNGKLHPLTELVNGGTLDLLIMDTTHPFPPSLRVQLSHDLAKGMEYLHGNGILHRDFNSHNALLRKNGSQYTAVVADFGLAAKNPHSVANQRLKKNQSVVGTPYWMAPEVLDNKPYDEKADVFSYGIVLCEIISRKEADPDEIPRLRDFSLDRKAFRDLPEVKSSLCPPLFVDLACCCAKFLPVERPSFTEIAEVLDEMYNISGKARSESLPPTPEKRLSWHYSQFSPTRINTCGLTKT